MQYKTGDKVEVIEDDRVRDVEAGESGTIVGIDGIFVELKLAYYRFWWFRFDEIRPASRIPVSDSQADQDYSLSVGDGAI